MAHEVEEMFSVREVPWHGIGTIVQEKLTAKEALIAGGLDWEVELLPVFAEATTERQLIVDPLLNGGEPKMVTVDLAEPRRLEVPDQFAVVRDSDSSVLGLVGSKYRAIQNRETFAFFDELVQSGDAKYETAGSLSGGRRVFLTAKVPRDLVIGGEDVMEVYLVMASSHDGSLAFTAAVTPVRVVCRNTLNLALNGAQQQWRMKHTESAQDRLSEARETLGLTFAYVDQFEAIANRLLAESFGKLSFEEMVKKLFPGEANKEGRFTDEQYSMIGLLESSPTIDDAIRYTKWGALNAVREYDDWGRDLRKSKTKTVAEQRTEATWFGKNVGRSNRTLEYLTSH